MKKTQKLQDAIGLIGEDLIMAAKKEKKKGIRFLRNWSIPAVAAAAMVAVLLGSFGYFGRLPLVKDSPASSGEENRVTPHATALYEALFPTAAAYPDAAEYEKDPEGWKDRFQSWREERKEAALMAKDAADLSPLVSKTMELFLKGEKNCVYSPVNIYLALAMVAETAGGETRNQILSFLDASSLSQLRQEAKALWDSHYRKDGVVTAHFASSLWINQSANLKQDPLEALGKNYYASSYQGEMGDPSFDAALQQWINGQTADFLQEQAGEITLAPETVLAMATTVYYRAMWENKFLESNTKEQTFYGKSGQIQRDFLHKETRTFYYWGEQFGAVSLPLEESGQMWLILPDEGVELSSLAKDPQVSQLLFEEEYSEKKDLIVNLSLPKFDVSSSLNLKEILKEAGIQNAFDMEKADFSPLSEEPLVLSEILHSSRVAVDEEGLTAAAFTVMKEAGASKPPEEKIEFNLNRPFLFAITSEFGQPLFIGTVCE